MNDMEAFSLRTQIDTLRNIAVSEYKAGKYEAAESALEKAYELARQADDLDLHVLVRSYLASVQRILGKKVEALAAESWLIGLATDPATSGRLKEDESLQLVASSFATFSDITRQLPGTDLDDLLRVLREGEAWMARIGKPEWTADLRIQRGLILSARGDQQGARQEMEASLAIKRRQQPVFGFTFETHLFQLADLLKNEPFNDYNAALDLTDEILSRPHFNFYELLIAYRIRSECRQQMGDLDGAEQEAREMVALAKGGDQKGDLGMALVRLGEVLKARGHGQEAIATYREAIALLDDLDEQFARVANSLAWQMYLAGVGLDEAADLARRGWHKDRADTNILQTLAAILVRQNHWDEAAELVREWVGRVDQQYVSSHWPDDLLLFKDALKHGHAAALARMLDRDVWEPMRVALEKAARGDDDLSDVPERLQKAVATLLAQLRDEQVPLAYPEFEGPST